ncbi:multicopper oxidase [Calocera viscosa TUFC12733]|uniref:Multicopper oxidase n=1 Tax=Calocera viscosa (strain TUFC12733) TaxID=1330018 RepID=A0A167JGS6_CALVF|nr:multicopper oxidase [Calocera viscosa TUFC12733]
MGDQNDGIELTRRVPNGESDGAAHSHPTPGAEPSKPARSWVPSHRILLPILTVISTILLIYPNLFSLPSLPGLSLFATDPNARFYLSPSAHTHRPPRIQSYDFVVREETRWPDGVKKQVFTINGLMPGPTIEMRSGDTLTIRLKNEMSEGTSLHFHGLWHPDGTVSQDGAIGLTQCPVPPNGTMTYEFRTDPTQAGTFWYHSHHTTQRADGLFGALIIHPPAAESHRVHQEPRWSRIGAELGLAKRDASQVGPDGSQWDEEIVLHIGDWFHRTGKVMFDWYWNKGSGGMEPVPDNALVNGVQLYDCQRSVRRITCDASKGTRPTYTLRADKIYKLRFINTGSLAQSFISVDEHELYVVEADGTNIDPVTVRELAVAPGQRYAVILRYVGEGKPLPGARFWLRHRLDQSCFKYPNMALDPTPKAIIHYTAPRTVASLLSGLLPVSPSATAAEPGLPEPTTSKWNITEEEVFDARMLLPLDLAARELPEPTMDPIVLYVTTVKFPQNGHLPWGYVNNTSWRPNEQAPLLMQFPPEDWMDTGRPLPQAWGKHEYVVQTSKNESVVVDLIINNLEDGLHPFHMHGHHFWPLHVADSARYGWGSYHWDYPPTLPTTAPAMRDTMVIPLRSYAVFRVKFDSPGMWMFHCHVLVHLKSGMAMTFDVMPDLVPERERQKVRESCAAYSDASLGV